MQQFRKTYYLLPRGMLPHGTGRSGHISAQSQCWCRCQYPHNLADRISFLALALAQASRNQEADVFGQQQHHSLVGSMTDEYEIKKSKSVNSCVRLPVPDA